MFGVGGVAPVGSVTESYLQSADPVAPLQCQWQMAEGRQREKQCASD
jgi:hypothetical protein